MRLQKFRGLVILLAGGLIATACTPTVQLAMPNEPITINMNVKIEHDIRVRVDRELEHVLSEDSGLF